MSFTVYKSSAGSGKTYTLVREYLKIVLLQPENYRHVLAITFTNKAANEMKERIVNVLRMISEEALDQQEEARRDKMLGELVDETGLDVSQLKENARWVLKAIIHNYSEFGVSTIDSFMHRVIKSFAFDLNVPVNFEVEIDSEEVLRQVIDIMVSRVGSDNQLTGFLVDFVQARADEEKNWNIEADLLKVSKLLKKEDSGDSLQRNAHLQLEDYVRINAAINKYAAVFEGQVKQIGIKAIGIVDSKGIPASAFYQGDRGLVGYFRYLAAGRFDKILPNNIVRKALEEDKWFSGKATRQDQEEIDEIKPALIELYEKINLLIDRDLEQYNLLMEIRKNLYPLAILGRINNILEEFKRENNILLISEFNQLIAGIVLEEPVPFIYERVGEKYSHFLVDEFQDTSVLQWQNLLPLIENSLANGHDNLIVGDAKQAIYRWRNGEVEQFVSLPSVYGRKEGPVHQQREISLKSNFIPKSLNSNYRSRPGIVSFNNKLFSYLSGLLPENEARIYDHVEQEHANNKKGGYVRIEFFPEGESDVTFEEFNCSRIKQHIDDVKGIGYSYNDIAILCRSNKSAAIIANFLLAQNIQVVSSESMLLVNSHAVRLITCLLTLVLNPADSLAVTELLNLLLKMGKIEGELHSSASSVLLDSETGQGSGREEVFEYLEQHGFEIRRQSSLSMPLYDLCEHIIRVFGLQVRPDPFLQFFLDVVLEREKNSEPGIREFLEFWERKKETLSIVVPEGIDAVRVMTIHKAKGLEFPVVICPFVQDVLKKTVDSLWLEVDNEVVPALRAALVSANKTIQETRYGSLVTREMEKSRLDMVNLLYVSFTRPTDLLFVISNHPENIRNAAGSVPELLVSYLTAEGMWEENKDFYEFGDRCLPSDSAGWPVPGISLSGFYSADWRDRAFLSYQAPANWEVEKPETRQEWGNLIHRILSQIKVVPDLDQVLDQLHYEGVIGDQELKTLTGVIREFLEREDVSVYFKPGLNVITESEIITPGGSMHRPDRIVADGDRVFVIDFKTGVPMEKHREQMKKYVGLIREMGGPVPQGVVLYLDHREPLFVA